MRLTGLVRSSTGVGDRVTAAGRVVYGVVKAIINRTDGVRLQVDYGKDETALVLKECCVVGSSCQRSVISAVVGCGMVGKNCLPFSIGP